MVAVFLLKSRAQILDDQGVLELGIDNFEDIIGANQFVFVSFYVPRCGHCTLLDLQLEKAAKLLLYMDVEIMFARIHATDNQELSSRYRVSGYPTMKFFRQGQPIDYIGKRKSIDIVDWLIQKTKPLTTVLKSPDITTAWVKNNDVNIVVYFEDSNHAAVKNIKSVAEELEDYYGYQFGITNTLEALSYYKIEEEGVYMFRDFDGNVLRYDGTDYSMGSLKSFIHDNSLPLLIEFKPKLPARLYASIRPALYLIVSSESKEYRSQKQIAAKISEDYANTINIVLMDMANENNTDFAQSYLGFKSNYPAMRLVHGIQDKYEPEWGELSEDKIKKYIENRLGTKGLGWTKSEELRSDWDKDPVKILVAKHFRSIITSMKNVLVMFYAPWCPHCKNFQSTWDELGHTLKDRGDIMVGKIDFTANQVYSMTIHDLPSIFLYQGDETAYIQYQSKRTLEGILTFLKDNGINVQYIKDEL